MPSNPNPYIYIRNSREGDFGEKYMESNDVNTLAGAITGMDLTGKVVVIKASELIYPWSIGDRRFLVQSGCGCSPSCSGSAVFGIFFADGDSSRFQRDNIAGLAANTELTPAAQEILDKEKAKFGK
jgi:hypothetical protein